MDISSFLWFDADVEPIAAAYQAIFDEVEVLETTPSADGGWFVAALRIHGHAVTLLNGGPHYRLTEAFSLAVSVDTQEEVDRLWEALREGGQESQCGWLTDRFGVTWQIVPSILPRLLGSPDREAADRAREAMLGMVKLDIAALQAAYDG